MSEIIEVYIDIAGQISEQTGIPKERVAEYLADEIMKFLGYNNPTPCGMTNAPCHYPSGSDGAFFY